MVAESFSVNLPDFDGKIENSALRSSLAFLKKISDDNYRIIEWDKKHIAVSLNVNVELPSLGNYNDIDIRGVEPIILVFDIVEYPFKAPMVYTDRMDFPKDKLAHLYIARVGRPPAFCYVRGNKDEWYANKRIQDLPIRISNWLRDAAAGELSSDGGQFEPLRLEGYSGTNTYDYDKLAELVRNQKSVFRGCNWSVGLFEPSKDQSVVSFRLVEIVTADNMEKVHEAFNKDKEKHKDEKDKRYYHYGFILWSNEKVIFEDYEIGLPTNWEEFKTYCERFKIDYEDIESIIGNGKVNHYNSFPVVLAIKRPADLIGFSSDIEFVNFKFNLNTDDTLEGKIINNFPLKFQAHNQPLTPTKARIISSEDEKLLGLGVVFGCGAIGSKIVMHLARSGQTALTLLDPDELSPHNLVRHALGVEYIGSNKAFALAESINKMFFWQSADNVLWGSSFKEGVFEEPETFKKYRFVLDCTASESFFNKLVMADNINGSSVFNCSVSDFGDLGIMYREGPDRNPRIDDLQAILYSRYQADKRISSWLMRERQAMTNNNLTIQVGVGCNSETTVLSDEKVSAHSAFFAASIRREITARNLDTGKIKLHRIIDSEEYSIETDFMNIAPFDVMPAVNDPSWMIRFKNGILKEIKKKAVKAKRKETGGVFVGTANYKTMTIHVTDIIDAPPDSIGDAVCFYRGHQGLPKQIKQATEKSGGQLGYIGEWHSHPFGPNGLSAVDMASVCRFKEELAELPTPLPVFLTVITPAGIQPYIF